MEIPLNEVFLLLNLGRSLGNAVGRALFMEHSALLHSPVHCPSADLNTFLQQCQKDSINTIVLIVRMLPNDLLDLDQKKLSAGLLSLVS